MSLEIQDSFAGSYARYSGNKDSWQVQPHRIGHVFSDWFDAWLKEHRKDNLGEEFTNAPQAEPVIRELFGKFFSSLKERNHVHIPSKVRESAIQEYLND